MGWRRGTHEQKPLRSTSELEEFSFLFPAASRRGPDPQPLPLLRASLAGRVREQVWRTLSQAGTPRAWQPHCSPRPAPAGADPTWPLLLCHPRHRLAPLQRQQVISSRLLRFTFTYTTTELQPLSSLAREIFNPWLDAVPQSASSSTEGCSGVRTGAMNSPWQMFEHFQEQQKQHQKKLLLAWASRQRGEQTLHVPQRSLLGPKRASGAPPDSPLLVRADRSTETTGMGSPMPCSLLLGPR